MKIRYNFIESEESGEPLYKWFKKVGEVIGYLKGHFQDLSDGLVPTV